MCRLRPKPITGPCLYETAAFDTKPSPHVKRVIERHGRGFTHRDLAANSLDTSKDNVVHFDLAGDHKDNLHRSGLTARAGAAGVVVSLVLTDQLEELRSVQR